MLTYSFENIGKESIYEYLYKCIKKDIIEGRLVKGEHLPSKRTLAVNLGISTITVENSYGQLMFLRRAIMYQIFQVLQG